MTETKHTPGPWFYRPDQYTDWGEVYAGQFRICQARDPLAMGHDILKLHRQAGTDPWEPNARLIAAAPDLLGALDAMYRAHHVHIFSPRGQETRSDRDTCRICGGNYRNTFQHITAQEGHPSDVKAEAERLARAAIARATGEKGADQ